MDNRPVFCDCIFVRDIPGIDFIARLLPLALLAGQARIEAGNRLAKTLIVAQFSIASFLMIATMFVSAQFNLLTSTTLGYPDKNLLSFTVAEGIKSRPVMELFRSAMIHVGGVEDAGYRNIGHFGGKAVAGVQRLTATYQRIDEHFIPTMKLKMLAGRNFSANFPSDSAKSVLVNETFVRGMHWQQAVGKTIDYLDWPGWGDRKVTVVGVVPDFHAASMKEKIEPVVFIQDDLLPLGSMMVRLNGDHVPATLLKLDRIYRSLSPNNPFDYIFQDEANRISYAPEARWRLIFSVASIITLIISVTGLWGLSLLTVNKKEKEIGIRKVLGASTESIVFLLSKDFALLVMLSFFIAIPVAWLVLDRWLQGFPYRITMDWKWFAVAGIAILLVTLTAVGQQLYRAAIKVRLK